jgi:hypothetical protein
MSEVIFELLLHPLHIVESPLLQRSEDLLNYFTAWSRRLKLSASSSNAIYRHVFNGMYMIALRFLLHGLHSEHSFRKFVHSSLVLLKIYSGDIC